MIAEPFSLRDILQNIEIASQIKTAFGAGAQTCIIDFFGQEVICMTVLRDEYRRRCPKALYDP